MINQNKQSELTTKLDEGISRPAWAYAIGTFGLGDVVTTAIGITHPEVVEAHPISKQVLGNSGVMGMLAVKAGALGLAYLAYNKTNPEYRMGIPVGLGILGSYIVVNNLNVLMELR